MQQQQPQQPAWHLRDFFLMQPDQHFKTKALLADYLDANYAAMRHDKPLALPVGDTPAFSLDRFKEVYDKWLETGAPRTLSMTLNAFQLRWQSLGTVNINYCSGHCQTEYVDNWDTFIERRGVLINPGGVKGAKNAYSLVFQISNMSSVLALIARLIDDMKHQRPVDERLKTAFLSLRVTLYLGYTETELSLYNFKENLEQSKRKQYNELDNIYLVQKWVDHIKCTRQTGKDEEQDVNGLDVFKYGLTLGNLVTDVLPAWAKKMNPVPPNMVELKVAIEKADAHALKQCAAKVDHGQLEGYNAIQLRVRFLKGFGKQACEALQEFGTRIEANAKFPVATNVLMGKDLLSKDAFQRTQDRSAVPSWRDGDFQVNMIRVLDKRHFQYNDGVVKTAGCFASDKIWVAFTRLIGAVESVLEDLMSTSASDQANSRLRDIWRGVYDPEFVVLSKAIPNGADARPGDMIARVKTDLPCVQKLLSTLEVNSLISFNASDKIQVDEAEEAEQVSEADEADAEKAKKEKAEKKKWEAEAEAAQASGFAMSAAEKIRLADKLNAAARKDRDEQLNEHLMKGAAEILQSRVKFIRGVEAAKRYMTTDPSNPTVRVALVDWTAPEDLQTGPNSRRMCKDPAKSTQRTVAENVSKLNFTHVYGTVLIRQTLAPMDTFMSTLKTSHPHRRSAYIPINLPRFQNRPGPALQSCLR